MKIRSVVRKISALGLGLALVASNAAFAVPCVTPDRSDAEVVSHEMMDHSSHAAHAQPSPNSSEGEGQPANPHSCSLMVVCGSALMTDATETATAAIDHALAAGIPELPITAATAQPEPPPPRA